MRGGVGEGIGVVWGAALDRKTLTPLGKMECEKRHEQVWLREPDNPEQEERARLLREVGDGLRRCFGGRAASLVEAADGSASRLVDLVTSHFPGFRDHAIHDGAQVFLYKRAQIFVADLWGAFKGCGLGSFGDVDALTTFADYRVPVVLRELGVLEYDDALAAHVAAKEEILPGSAYEIEIRAW